MMVRSIVFHLFAPVLIAVAILLPASTALAATNPYAGINCTGRASEAVACSSGRTDPLSGSDGIIYKITKVVAGLAGTAAVVVMVVSGIRYITSNGDAEAVAKSKRIIILAAVGLTIIVLGQAIIGVVLSKV